MCKAVNLVVSKGSSSSSAWGVNIGSGHQKNIFRKNYTLDFNIFQNANFM